jgi:carbon storage regulator
MLVLTRRCGERIRIGDDIWVTVVSLERGKVRLGIEAPRDVHILRQELFATPPGRSAALPKPTAVAASGARRA